MQRVKSNENQLRERVVAAGQYAFVAAGLDALESVTDGVRAGGAGVGDYLTRRGQATSLERVPRRLLRWIIRDPNRRLPRAGIGLLERAVVMLTETHPAARRPDHSQLGAKLRGLLAHLA